MHSQISTTAVVVPVPVRSPSTLSSRRYRDKALLIGLEYRHEENGTVSPLTGIHDDVRKFRDYLIKHELYDSNNITMLLDDGVGDIRGDEPVEADPNLYRLNKPNRKTIVSTCVASLHGSYLYALLSTVARISSSCGRCEGRGSSHPPW